MRIAVPDLVTNSYFPALAAEELGLYRAEGVDAHVDLLAAVRGDVGAVKGLRIGAAPGPDAALRRLLAEAGIDLERDKVHVARISGAERPGVSFGVLAAEALESRQIDGFWANALVSETAVRRGVGRIIVDVRRGDGPPGAGRFTFAALVTTEALIDRDPEAVAAVVRGIVSAQHRLREDPRRATEGGRRRFPPAAADMIAALVERDLPFYDPVIDEDAVQAMSEFSIALGLIQEKVPYDRVVATRFRDLWRGR